jgi:hypothetical protein
MYLFSILRLKHSATTVHLERFCFPHLKLFKVTNVSIFWDISPYNPYVNRRFLGTNHLQLRGRKAAEYETGV